VTLLKSLEAIDADGRITDEGRALARMPLHPRLGHMVHRASEEGEGLVAAELAVLLTERGLGGDDIDLLHRLNQFGRDRSRRGEEARRLARRWAETAGAVGTTDEPDGIGRHLARAYPDRIAQGAGAPGRFRLANGRAASLEASDSLARESFLVVTDITGSAANGRIRGAGRIDLATIEELFGQRISEETAMEFDAGSRSIRARQVRRLGALRLAEHPAPPDDLEKAAELLAEGIAAVGVDALPWTSEQNSLRARATYLHQRLGEPWPDLSDTALAREPEGWLTPFLIGRTALGDITADDLAHALGSRLSRAEQSELERLLPSHFEAPTGSRVPIDYGAENGPAIEIRVQELFGLDRHPAVGGGKIPLLVVLLSPAHRPIQTTRDLPGFWRGSWRDVAKDLKGRYPRHFWPDDPLAAAATRRAKPRA
jgi:ATP-dependent helicase HrpB